MKTLTLTNSDLLIQVDDSDYTTLNKFTWRACPNRNTIYAATGASQAPYNNRYFIHELILNKPFGCLIDHKDIKELPLERNVGLGVHR